MTTTLYTPDRDEFAALLEGEPRYRLDQVWSGLYTQLAAPEHISNVPKALRERLAKELPTALTQVVRRVSDGGDTVKYLWELHDGSRVETDGVDIFTFKNGKIAVKNVFRKARPNLPPVA